MSKQAPQWTTAMEEICEIADMESPAFNSLLGYIQDCLDPDRKYDCGGFASVFFSGHDWAGLDESERLVEVERYVEAQRQDIADCHAWECSGGDA